MRKCESEEMGKCESYFLLRSTDSEGTSPRSPRMGEVAKEKTRRGRRVYVDATARRVIGRGRPSIIYRILRGQSPFARSPLPKPRISQITRILKGLRGVPPLAV